ncbi:hypothetical protein ACFSZS_13255 [Seohaeicola zhoushanensis]
MELSDSVLLRGSYTFTDSEQQSGAYAGLPLARTRATQRACGWNG